MQQYVTGCFLYCPLVKAYGITKVQFSKSSSAGSQGNAVVCLSWLNQGIDFIIPTVEVDGALSRLPPFLDY